MERRNLMSNTGEIKLGKEGYLSSKSFFDTKVGNIKDTQKTFDNGIDLLYKSWTGKAKSAAVPVTYNLYKKYTSLIEDADKLSESFNKIYEVMLNMDNALGNSYNLNGNIIGGKR